MPCRILTRAVINVGASMDDDSSDNTPRSRRGDHWHSDTAPPAKHRIGLAHEGVMAENTLGANT
jgi:hypothetical protein